MIVSGFLNEVAFVVKIDACPADLPSPVKEEIFEVSVGKSL